MSLTTEQIAALRGLDACAVADAIETFGERLRNEGFTDSDIHCFFPELPSMVGHAATIKIRGSAPPTAGSPYLDNTAWLDYVLSIPAPRVVVIQDVATRPGLGSLLGAVLANILQRLDCAGVVTNGSVRDIPAMEALGHFQVFAGNVSVSHAYAHIVEVGGPVEIGGLKISPGDLLHGDRHGVQSVPMSMVAQIPPVAEKIKAHEAALIRLCQSPDFSPARMRAALAKPLS
jgi:regulator of RNase E activity RraA